MAEPTREEALKYTVQEHYDAEQGGRLGTWMGYYARGPILPVIGDRQRLRDQFLFWNHDYAGLFTSAAGGIARKIASTPWEIRADGPWADYFQSVFMQAQFSGWDGFISRLVTNFHRYDIGSWLELIGRGEPDGPIQGPIIGIASLDSLRCWPTGDPEFPLLYYDLKQRVHKMHFSRVVQFVDQEETNEYFPGWGRSALTRAIGPVYRQILMNRYIEAYLDDKPAPGLVIFHNVNGEKVEAALARMNRDIQTDEGGKWGRVLEIFEMQPDHPTSVEWVPYQQVPEKYDFKAYTELDVKLMAAALYVDVQEFWELAGQGQLGTGTQSEILHQKSRGKGIGGLLKQIERTLNQALPDDAEFGFKYANPDEDMEQANKAATWANAALTMISQGTITQQEGRELLANQVPEFADVLTDDAGRVRRLPDADPKTAAYPGEVGPAPVLPTALPGAEQVSYDTGARSFEDTAASFSRRFAAIARDMAGEQRQGAIIRALLREELLRSGTAAYNDGFREGGADPDDMDEETKAGRMRQVVQWLAAQEEYINNFANRIRAGDITPADLARSTDAWIAKALRSIRYVGQAAAAPNRMMRWQLGQTEEHCRTCLTLNGQVHKLKDYINSGLYPGSSSLECGGYQCDCRLIPAPDARASGRLPNTVPVRRGLLDRLVNFVRRLGGVSHAS